MGDPRRRDRRSRRSRPSSSAASSSRRAGRRTRPTSSPRSTSAASSARPSASARSSRWSAASPARSPAGAARAATSPPARTPRPSRPSSPTSWSTSWRRSTRRSGSTSASRRSRSARPASSSRVEDTMESILDWNTKEGMIFRGGSGSGINLSKIRSSKEQLSKGGLASGPVSLHARGRRVGGHDQVRRQDAPRGQDGRARRRPSRHPATSSGARRARRRRPRRCARPGFDMSIDGEGFHSIQYQNANNSVRVTREFLDAVERGEEWQTIARVSGRAGRHLRRARADGPDRRGRLALRRSGRPVRHDDQRLAHLPEHGADQRVQPVLGIHARRRLGLQPRLDQPPEVPARGRHLRRGRLRAHRRRRLPGPGDRRRVLELPDRRRSRATRRRCASSASATRTSARS